MPNEKKSSKNKDQELDQRSKDEDLWEARFWDEEEEIPILNMTEEELEKASKNIEKLLDEKKK